MTKHALLAPSSAHRWMYCSGSVADCIGLPESVDPNEPADEGTFAHACAQVCLTDDRDASACIGEKATINGIEYVCDEAMADALQVYIDSVRHFTADGSLLVEQALPLEWLTGEKDAFGTADAIGLLPRVLQVHDLKFGRGYDVPAEGNEQGLMYALAALREYGAVWEFDEVQVFIHQPRLYAEPKVAIYTIAQLQEFEFRVRHAVEVIAQEPRLIVGEKQCRFCPVQATCPELSRVVHERIASQFDAVPVEEHPDRLADNMALVDLVENWCAATRAEAHRRLENGVAVRGYKMVAGRRGNRKYENEEIAETLLTTVLGEDAYDMKLISVAEAEKKLKKAHPAIWAKVVEVVGQADGKPTVAPDSDKRPALAAAVATADQFGVVDAA